MSTFKDYPLFSIIIPTYNSAKTLATTLNSLVNQKGTNFEVLIIDGLSTDSTLAIAKNYNDERIKIISEKDFGIYDAMNKGIKLAQGEWLYFLGSDDELYDENVLYTIKISIGKLLNNVFYGNVLISGDASWAKDGTLYDGMFTTEKLFNKNICHQAIFYNRQFVKKEIGYYNLHYRICADWDFNLRCWAKTKWHFLNIVISKFKAGGESTINSSDYNFNSNFIINLVKYFKLSPFDKKLRSINFYQKDIALLQKNKNIFLYTLNKIKNKIKMTL